MARLPQGRWLRDANIHRLEVELGIVEPDTLWTAKVVASEPAPLFVLKIKKIVEEREDYYVVPRTGGRPPYLWHKNEPPPMMIDADIEGYLVK